MDTRDRKKIANTSAKTQKENMKVGQVNQIDTTEKTEGGIPKKTKAAQQIREATKGHKPTEAISEFVEKVIKISRVAKVTKGGKKLSFSALVVVGDTKGNVGYCLGKANDVAGAIRKAMSIAKKNMIKIPMKGSTITHEIIGLCGAAKVLLKPASDGTGVIASGPVRAVCDAAGIRNILTKCHKSNNPLNVVKATMNGLNRLKSLKEQY